MHVSYPLMLRANHHGCEYVLMAVQADLFMGTAKPPKSHLKTTLYSKSESDQVQLVPGRMNPPGRFLTGVVHSLGHKSLGRRDTVGF